jgi:hypothetical protein
MFLYLDVVHVIWGHIRRITNFSMMYIYIRILLNIVKWNLSVCMQHKVHNTFLYTTNKKKLFTLQTFEFIFIQKTKLGPFMLLCTTDDDQLINWWKNQIDFVRIKFHPNENIKWNCMQFELISNSTIGLKFNWIEKNENENGWKIFFWRWCWKINVTLLPN